MRHFIAFFLLSILVAGCGDPSVNDIVFGPTPLKQVMEQGDQFKKLSREERVLLVSYLTLCARHQTLGIEMTPAPGRTVGEVLKDARTLQERAATKVESAKRTVAAL